MAERLTEDEFESMVREALNGRSQSVRRVKERILNVIENFDLPPDPEVFLRQVHDELGDRFSPGDKLQT